MRTVAEVEGAKVAHCVELIVSLLQGQKVEIFGKNIHIETGVMQGSPLSPKLFCFVVDTAISDSEVLTRMADTSNLFAYANDLGSTLLGKKHALEVMTEFSKLQKNQLTMHMGKTKFLSADKDIVEAAAEVGVESV